MAKVTDLPNVGTLTDEDVFPIVDTEGLVGSRGKKVSASQIRDYLRPDGDARYANKTATDSALGDKADKAVVDAALAGKADQTSVNAALSLKADADAVSSALALKANTSDVSSALALKADDAFTQGLSGAVTRTKDDKLKDVVSVKDFGAKGDGVTDDGAAIQKALDAVNAAGGGVVFLPPGTYRKAKTSPTLSIYSNTTLLGVGPASTILHDDVVTAARVDLLQVATGARNVRFENFQILGVLDTYPGQVNQSQALGGENVDGLSIVGVTFRKLRYMATSFVACRNVIASGNILDEIQRDGIRFQHSSNVTITNNVIRRVSDDCINVHARDQETTATVLGPTPSGIVIADNVIEDSQSIKCLGAKALSITGNVFRRMIRSAILVQMDTATGAEGNTPIFAVNIANNTILDTFASKGANTVIRVTAQARAKGGLSAQPGLITPPYAYNWTNNVDTGGVNPGNFGINISGNIIARTLPAVAKFSDWGFGQYFDKAYSDPAVIDTDFDAHYIVVDGPVYGLNIKNNQLSGSKFNGIQLNANGTANGIDFSSTLIEGNVFSDMPGVGIAATSTGSSAKELIIRGNVFDMDPYFRAATHNADNTWSGSGNCIAINLGNALRQAIVDGNVFKNCGTTVSANSDRAVFGTNYVLSKVVGMGDNASNKGVRLIPQSCGFIFITYDADPASATYGQITTIPATVASAMPTTGTYVYNHFVRNSGPVVVSGKVLLGWVRLTTGSNHVLDTDWAAVYATTS